MLGTNELLYRSTDASLSKLTKKHHDTLSCMRSELESQLYSMPEPLPATSEVGYAAQLNELKEIMDAIDEEVSILKQEQAECAADAHGRLKEAERKGMTTEQKANQQWFSRVQDKQFNWNIEAVSAIKLVMNAMTSAMSGEDIDEF